MEERIPMTRINYILFRGSRSNVSAKSLRGNVSEHKLAP